MSRREPPALVAGELRGYRRFRLHGGALHPAVHTASGPWGASVQHAVCAAGGEHAAPAAGCGCGLYAWYHAVDAGPGSGYGDVAAVVAASGRVVLGDHGFRAAAARVEAVAVPRLAGRGAVRALARRYPHTAVYRSRRRMVRAHPPHDLRGLGVAARPSPAGRDRRAALALWACGVVALYATLALPAGTVQTAPPAVLVACLVAVLGWQGVLVHLVLRQRAG
ncbi:hypothetical protein NUM3379_15200 [Kineococcus sp. NUM-3379]